MAKRQLKGELIRQGRASHLDGTEVDSVHLLKGLNTAILKVGARKATSEISISGQQLTWKNAYLIRNIRSNGNH
jgi:hypothetical protein